MAIYDGRNYKNHLKHANINQISAVSLKQNSTQSRPPFVSSSEPVSRSKVVVKQTRLNCVKRWFSSHVHKNLPSFEWEGPLFVEAFPTNLKAPFDDSQSPHGLMWLI